MANSPRAGFNGCADPSPLAPHQFLHRWLKRSPAALGSSTFPGCTALGFGDIPPFTRRPRTATATCRALDSPRARALQPLSRVQEWLSPLSCTASRCGGFGESLPRFGRATSSFPIQELLTSCVSWHSSQGSNAIIHFLFCFLVSR